MRFFSIFISLKIEIEVICKCLPDKRNYSNEYFGKKIIQLHGIIIHKCLVKKKNALTSYATLLETLPTLATFVQT